MKQIGVKTVLAITCALLGVAAPATAATVEVGTAGLNFVPPDVVITVGDSIHFTGLATHTVAEVDDAGSTVWNGGFHSPGGAGDYTQPFNTAGLFHYICEPHIAFGMRGTVTVEEATIPTVSTWGMAVLVLIVLAAGTVVFRRAKPAIVTV